MDLLLDIKKYIGFFDAYVWFKMYIIDEEFKEYASSNEGIHFFTSNFLTTVNGITKLDFLDIIHNINDLPAMVTDETQNWYCMGKLHRKNDLPATIWKKGAKQWFNHGQCHRENDLPAYMDTNGDKAWWYNDHAIIDSNERQEWWCKGLKHRENDLPAIISKHGAKFWYYNGKSHRENDLPAYIGVDSRHWLKSLYIYA